MNSSRMPNKTLKSFFNGKSILEIQIDNLLKLNLPIVVATTKNKLDDQIIAFCTKKNITFYRGDEDNVLKRYKEIIEIYNFKYFFRICSDNPFLNINFIKKLHKYSSFNYDYISFALKNKTPAIKTHYGFFGELVKSECLNTIIKKSKKNEDLEHVTKFIYENTNLFKIKYLPIPNYIESKKNIRLTIDTKKDFDLVSNIYSKTFEKNQSISHVLKVVNSNPNFKKTMQLQIKKFLK